MLFKRIWDHKVFVAFILSTFVQVIFSTYFVYSQGLTIDRSLTIQVPLMTFVTLMVYFLLIDVFLLELKGNAIVAQYRITIVFGAFSSSSYILANFQSVITAIS